ncbi:MAG: hypothetical protein ACN4GW_19920 [Desulforhopalus sp.]
MAISWLTELILIFHPEDSSTQTPPRQETQKCRHMAAGKIAPVSLKAALWIAISVASGLFIGQL